MNRCRSLIAAALIGLLAPACGKKLDKDGHPVTIGRLRLRTFPSGAKVWIDGELKVEATPATLFLSEGEHTLKMQLEGAEPRVEHINFEGGASAEIDLDLPRPPDATITVLSDEVGAKVIINGYTRGTTPVWAAVTKPGSIDITIATLTGRAKSIKTILTLGEQKRIEAFFDEVQSTLPPPPPPPPPPLCLPKPRGYLTLGLEPEGEVYDEEDHLLGKTPLSKLAVDPGEHRLLLKSKDRQRWVLVEVEEEKNAIYRFRLLESDRMP
ncbi:MAG: PEGA domain-containing protein [Myxococcota bacterium]